VKVTYTHGCLYDTVPLFSVLSEVRLHTYRPSNNHSGIALLTKTRSPNSQRDQWDAPAATWWMEIQFLLI